MDLSFSTKQLQIQNLAKELAQKIKLLHPKTKIMIGGIHPSLLPEEFIEIADHIVIGEGENVILDIVVRENHQNIQIIYVDYGVIILQHVVEKIIVSYIRYITIVL